MTSTKKYIDDLLPLMGKLCFLGQGSYNQTLLTENAFEIDGVKTRWVIKRPLSSWCYFVSAEAPEEDLDLMMSRMQDSAMALVRHGRNMYIMDIVHGKPALKWHAVGNDINDSLFLWVNERFKAPSSYPVFLNKTDSWPRESYHWRETPNGANLYYIYVDGSLSLICRHASKQFQDLVAKKRQENPQNSDFITLSAAEFHHNITKQSGVTPLYAPKKLLVSEVLDLQRAFELPLYQSSFLAVERINDAARAIGKIKAYNPGLTAYRLDKIDSHGVDIRGVDWIMPYIEGAPATDVETHDLILKRYKEVQMIPADVAHVGNVLNGILIDVDLLTDRNVDSDRFFIEKLIFQPCFDTYYRHAFHRWPKTTTLLINLYYFESNLGATIPERYIDETLLRLVSVFREKNWFVSLSTLESLRLIQQLIPDYFQVTPVEKQHWLVESLCLYRYPDVASFVRAEHPDRLPRLFELAPYLNTMDVPQKTHGEADLPLISAVRSGNIVAVNELLASYDDVNQVDSHGNTPLMLAIVHRQWAIFKALLAESTINFFWCNTAKENVFDLAHEAFIATGDFRAIEALCDATLQLERSHQTSLLRRIDKGCYSSIYAYMAVHRTSRWDSIKDKAPPSLKNEVAKLSAIMMQLQKTAILDNMYNLQSFMDASPDIPCLLDGLQMAKKDWILNAIVDDKEPANNQVTTETKATKAAQQFVHTAVDLLREYNRESRSGKLQSLFSNSPIRSLRDAITTLSFRVSGQPALLEEDNIPGAGGGTYLLTT